MIRVIRLRSPSSHTSVRLDDLLNETLPGEIAKQNPNAETSRSKIRRLIVAGAVMVDGRQERRPATLLRKNNTVTVTLDEDKFLFEKKPDDITFEMSEAAILYEDESILVVNKPAGLPTEATMVQDRDHLHAAIKRYLLARDHTRNEPYVGLHHRLDRETSGVILFTKTRTVNAAIHDIFLKHRIKKEYEALAHNNSYESGSSFEPGNMFFVENELGRITTKSQAGKWGAIASGGDPARTDFTVLEVYAKGLHILAVPLTGRTHQIRVHLAGLGLPILGDTLYGGPDSLPGGVVISRVMLHAARLTFPHPVTGMELMVEAPLPEDFHRCLAILAP
jgi:RluA family pseudouridine synthase